MLRFLVLFLSLAPLALATVSVDTARVSLPQFHDEASLLVAKGYRSFRHRSTDAEARKTIVDVILVRDLQRDPVYRYSSVAVTREGYASHCTHFSRGKLQGNTVSVDEYRFDNRGCGSEAGLREYKLQWMRDNSRWGNDVVGVTLQTSERSSRLYLDDYIVYIGQAARDGKLVHERISWHMYTPDKVMRYTVVSNRQAETLCESLTVAGFPFPELNPFRLEVNSAQVKGGHVFCTAQDTGVRAPMPRCLGDDLSPRCGGGGVQDLSQRYYYELRPAAHGWQRTLVTNGQELILQIPIYAD